MSKQEQTQKIEQEKNLKKGIHIYTVTERVSEQSGSVCQGVLGKSVIPVSEPVDVCVYMRHYVPVRCSPGSRARSSEEYCLSK